MYRQWENQLDISPPLETQTSVLAFVEWNVNMYICFLLLQSGWGKVAFLATWGSQSDSCSLQPPSPCQPLASVRDDEVLAKIRSQEVKANCLCFVFSALHLSPRCSPPLGTLITYTGNSTTAQAPALGSCLTDYNHFWKAYPEPPIKFSYAWGNF